MTKDNDHPTVELKPTYCRLCEAQCGVIAELTSGRISKIYPDRDHPISSGHICVKAEGMVSITYDPDRITKPLKKNKRSGKFEETTWELALTDIASRLDDILGESGAESVAMFSGNPTSFATLHHAYAPAFIHALGGTKVFNTAHVDTGAKNLALELVYGSPVDWTFPDLEHCDFLLMLGANPMVSHMSIIAEPRVWHRLKSIHKRDGVVVVDPRRTETASRFEHVAIKPDSDAWLLGAMLKHIFSQSLYDPSVKQRCQGWDALEAAVANIKLEVASQYCGLSVNGIVTLAERFAKADTAACYGRVGTNRGRFSTLVNVFIEVLNIVTGRFGHKGGWVIGRSPFVSPEAEQQYPAYGSTRSRIGDLPLIAGLSPGGTLAEDINTPGPGQIRALFVDSGNPVRSYPGGEKLSAALEQLDLMVSLDLYITESSRHADYILPAVTFYERPDLTDLWVANAPRPWLQYTDAVIEPVGECRLEFDVYNDILARLNRPALFADPAADNPPRPELMSVVDTMLRAGPYGDQFGARQDGLSIERLRQDYPHGKQLAEGVDAPGSWKLVRHENHRPRLWSTLAEAELQRLLSQQASPESAETLKLFGRRTLTSMNSWMHNVQRLVRSNKPTLLMHPSDASDRSLKQGEVVAITSSVGSIEVDLEISESVIPGSVCYPHGWGHAGGWSRANELPGADINELASSRPEDWEQVSGMVHLDGIEVTVKAARDAFTR